jgi:hypothetical protein
VAALSAEGFAEGNFSSAIVARQRRWYASFVRSGLLRGAKRFHKGLLNRITENCDLHARFCNWKSVGIGLRRNWRADGMTALSAKCFT